MRRRFRRFSRGRRPRRIDWVKGGDYQSSLTAGATGGQQALIVHAVGGLFSGGLASELVTPATLVLHEDNVTAMKIRGNIHWLFNWAAIGQTLFNAGAPVVTCDVVISMREAIVLTTLDDQFNPPVNVGSGLILQNDTVGLFGAATTKTGAESYWHSSRDIMWQRESHWHPSMMVADTAGVINFNYPFSLGANAVQPLQHYPSVRVSLDDEIEVMTKRKLGSHETIAYVVTIGATVVGLDMSLAGIGISGDNPVIAVGIGYLKVLLKHN